MIHNLFLSGLLYSSQSGCVKENITKCDDDVWGLFTGTINKQKPGLFAVYRAVFKPGDSDILCQHE